MARRGKRRRRRRTKAEQREILASAVRPDNDPLIKDLYEKLPAMTNLEAAELGLAIQRVIRGENLQETDPEAYQLYMRFMAEADAATKAWETDKKKFLEDSYNEANRPTEEEAVRLRKEVQQRYATIKEDVRLNATQKKHFMMDHIKNGPFEEVYVEPKMVMGRVGDSQQMQVEGQVIGLAGVQMYLEPGVNKKVPKLYAERYRQILAGKQETEEREAILQGRGIDPTGGDMYNPKDGWEQLAKKQHEINAKYGSKSGAGEAGDDWMHPTLHQKF